MGHEWTDTHVPSSSKLEYYIITVRTHTRARTQKPSAAARYWRYLPESFGVYSCRQAAGAG